MRFSQFLSQSLKHCSLFRLGNTYKRKKYTNSPEKWQLVRFIFLEILSGSNVIIRQGFDCKAGSFRPCKHGSDFGKILVLLSWKGVR